jgi:hypothetical protein
LFTRPTEADRDRPRTDLDYSVVIPHRFGVGSVFLLLKDVFPEVIWWGGGRVRLRGREGPQLCVVVENFVVCG